MSLYLKERNVFLLTVNVQMKSTNSNLPLHASTPTDISLLQTLKVKKERYVMRIHTVSYRQPAVKPFHTAIPARTVKQMTTASASALVDNGPRAVSQSEHANWGLPESNTLLSQLSSATEAVKKAAIGQMCSLPLPARQ